MIPSSTWPTTSVQLADGLSDRVETRFGFREFTAKGKSFYLNGKKIVLKTTFNEAFYPHSLAYPRDQELLRKEFKLIKEGNINMVRPWRKPQPPVVLRYGRRDWRSVCRRAAGRVHGQLAADHALHAAAH